MIFDDSVDAVYISTPIGTHAELAIKAASAENISIVKKSSTDSFNSAKKIVECSKNNNVRIMEVSCLDFILNTKSQRFDK